MKKVVRVLLICSIVVCFGLVGCGQKAETADGSSAVKGSETTEEEKEFNIERETKDVKDLIPNTEEMFPDTEITLECDEQNDDYYYAFSVYGQTEESFEAYADALRENFTKVRYDDGYGYGAYTEHGTYWTQVLYDMDENNHIYVCVEESDETEDGWSDYEEGFGEKPITKDDWKEMEKDN